MIWLIQGIFFQNQSWLDVRCVPIEGNVAVIVKGLIQTIFSGAIYPDGKDVSHTLVGQMFDHYGYAVLTDVLVSDDEVRFTKRYERRQDTILYTLTSAAKLLGRTSAHEWTVGTED